MNVGGDDTALAEGDAMQFDSDTPHSYHRHGEAPASAIIVVVP